MAEENESEEQIQRNAEQMQRNAEEQEENIQQYVCEICGASFASQQALAAHMKKHKGKGGKEGVGVGREPEEGKESETFTEIKPPEVEIIDEAIAFIEERLSQVYGVEKYSKMIVNALRDNPAPLRDANMLHAFIKQIAPRAYDAHVSMMVVTPLYIKFPNLPQAVDKYLSMVQTQPPQYGYAPQPYGYTTTAPYYYPTPTYYSYPPAYQYPPTQGYPPYPAQYPQYPPKPRKTYKIVYEGQEIETDEEGFLAWQRFLREREEDKRRAEEHELAMKKLEAEIKKIAEETSKKEPTVPVKIGDVEYQVPVSLAPIYLALRNNESPKKAEELSKKVEELSKKLEEEKEARHKTEVEMIKKELEELKRRPSFFEELQAYQRIAQTLGYHKSGKTTADLLDSLVERLDQRAQQLLEKIPSPGGEWKPEVVRTPEERAKKAGEIMKKLEKSEEVLQAEDELIKAAAKVGRG